MELHQLRYLRAIVRTGSVTAAAETEHVSQPSVSRQVGLLERELGVPLLHRVGRGVVPTEAALQLADLADRLFDDLAATTSAIASRDDAAPASLRICATETVADHLVPSALAPVLRRFRNVSVSVEMLGTIDAVTRVLSGDFDFAIVVLPINDSRLAVSPLFSEEVLLAVPAGEQPTGPVPLADALARDDVLLSMRGLGLRAQVDAAAAASGDHLHARVEMRSQRALLSMVAAGAGAAFVPAVSLAAEIEGVRARQLDPPLYRQIGWIRRPGRHLPPAAFALLDGIREAHANLVSATGPRTSGELPPRPSGNSA